MQHRLLVLSLPFPSADRHRQIVQCFFRYVALYSPHCALYSQTDTAAAATSYKQKFCGSLHSISCDFSKHFWPTCRQWISATDTGTAHGTTSKSKPAVKDSAAVALQRYPPVHPNRVRTAPKGNSVPRGSGTPAQCLLFYYTTSQIQYHS
jgi:hypothetical protein